MGVYITVKVTPGARTERLEQGTQADLNCFVREHPENNKANKAVLRCLSRALGCPLSDVEITAGHTARIKRIFIATVPDKQTLWTLLDIPVQHAICDVASS